MLCAGIFTSCDDDDDCSDNEGNGKPAPSFTSKVSSSVYGYVTDESDTPMVGVTVKAGEQTASTDEDGYFSIRNAQVVKGAGVVTAEKSGYFRGIRSWISEANKDQFVRIKLIPKTIAGTFNSEAGGNVTLPNGLKLDFPEGAIIEEGSGTEYKGIVNVAMEWINPVAPDLSEKMPGDLRALNSEGLMQGLITYGMVAAELTAADGKILQLAEGKTAELRTPIESELQAKAPSEMPLWYFDEEKGFWVEEGKTVKTGNEYVGQVSHFSFWNADVPYNFVFLKARIVDAEGKPMVGYTVSIKASDFSYAYSYTDAEGYVSGYVPKSADLTLYVYSAANRDCVIFSHKFSSGSASRDIDLGTLTAKELTVKSAKVKGSLLACDGSTITKGYLNYSIGTAYYRTNVTEEGTYEFTVYFCEDSPILDIKAYNTENPAMNSTQITLKEGENNIEPIMVCDEIEGSYAVVYAGEETYIVNGGTGGYTTSEDTNFHIWTEREEANIDLGWKGGMAKTGEFNYSGFNLWVYFRDQDGTDTTGKGNISYQTDEQTTGKVTITEFKKTATNPDKYTLKGSFEIKGAIVYDYTTANSNDNQESTTREDVSGSFSLEDWQPQDNMPR